MGEGESKDNVGEKKKHEPGKKQDNNYVNVIVLKVDIHCKGCANKIMRFLNSVHGVEKIKAEIEANKLTVEGKVDPSQIREKLQEKIKKKVEILSPQPKKDKENKGGDNNTTNKKNDNAKNKDQVKKPEENKPKEPPVRTIAVKVVLHCEGCILKIQRAISKIRGLQSMSIDREKDLVTVTGTIDAKALVDTLKGKIKRTVEIVPLKKEGKKDITKDDAKGGSNGDGGEGKDNKVGGGVATGAGGAGSKKGGDSGNTGAGQALKEGENQKNENKKNEKMENNKTEFFGPTPTFANYGNMSYGYTYGYMYGEPYHAPQLFSDENPNACSLM